MTQSVVVGRAPRRRPSQGRAWAQRAGCRLRPRGARRPCCRESCFELVVCACSDQDSKRLVVSDASRCSRRRVGQQRSRHAVCGRIRARRWAQPTSERHPVEEQGTAAAWIRPRPRRGRGSWAARRAAPASERPGRARAQRAGCGLRPRGARRPCYRESSLSSWSALAPPRFQEARCLGRELAARCAELASSDHAMLSAREIRARCWAQPTSERHPVEEQGTAAAWFQVRPRSGRGSSAARRAVPASERSGRAGARSRPSSSWGARAPGRHERLLPQDCRASTSARFRDPASGCALGRNDKDSVCAAGLQRPPHNKRLMPTGPPSPTI